MSNNYIKILLLAGLALCFISSFETNFSFAAPSPDAIAIRVIPNPEHLSALDWYKIKAFGGSPQSILIDGYEAIRDGRTVYVNAANISGNSLYTNIYLISYDQNAQSATIDIFGRILSHWKFNSNITGIGQCKLNSLKNCLDDLDCEGGDYCLSQKAKIIRDVRRLADLVEAKTAINEHQAQVGSPPKLISGTYLSGKTLSVWPSWSQTLTPELGLASLPVDPINKLGDCGEDRFNQITCWDENSKEFAGSIPSALPLESRVYAYQFVDEDNYTLCAELETEYGNISSFDCL